MQDISKSKVVDYIVNSKKPYPEWLRTHTVFKELGKIDKIFPKIGLPNFREQCEIMNSQEAKTCASYLGSRIIRELQNANGGLYRQLETSLNSKEKDRNELCFNIQNTINLINCVNIALNRGDYVKIIDGRVVLRLNSDVFGVEKAPVFRKDEALLRVVNKIHEMCEVVKVPMTKIEACNEFKDFSRVNLPNKKYTLVFSSYGEEGAWDIGTISMRGVASCQSWTAPQSRGLIGSISSKFVGVIYVESDQEIPGYGNKMLNRSMVRFAINRKTRKPALIIDRMYPNHNEDTASTFKKILKNKSGLEVFITTEISNDYYIPDEPSRGFLRAGEFSYMDHNIPVEKHSVPIKKVDANISALTNKFKESIIAEISAEIKVRTELYTKAYKILEDKKAEFDLAKKKWEDENLSKPEAERSELEAKEPKMDIELQAFGKGGIINLFTHCDKKYGVNTAPRLFIDIIFNSIPFDTDVASKEEYHRKFLMNFLKNQNAVKEAARKAMSQGTWMKSFPKSAEKFFNSTFANMKGYFLASVKEIIKKSN